MTATPPRPAPGSAPPGAPRTRTRTRIRVAVLGGGRSTEHDVSLASAAAVATALDPTRHDVVPLTLRRDHGWEDATGRILPLAGAVEVLAGCDVAFPLLHGRDGEDGTIAALLELVGIPYVGSGVRAGALGMDKHATKLLAASLGISVAPGLQLTRASAADWTWERPVVVKPAGGGSSHGVGLALTAADAPAALGRAFAMDDRVLVEHLVAGREIDVPVLRAADGGLRLGPPVEVVTEGIFDAGAKYGGEAVFRIPAPLEAHELAALHGAAGRLAEALDARGVVRVDFFLTPDGPVLNEVNTTPGMTAASQVPRAFAADGLAFPGLLAHLVDDALDGRPGAPGVALSPAASRSRSSS
ncbi:D-alanine--D-alanine ligase family protein [Clavibacter michiganensis]|uniref:D-alanine--D-alanine ligase family protein n=1 Tax=Clavibacter michiganensis TaxID=28447 RepID=UPI0009B80F1E|nr:D-alanine--D-alanine ligase [Clavibacter michiganensis]